MKKLNKCSTAFIITCTLIALSCQLKAQNQEKENNKTLFAEGLFAGSINEFDDGVGVVGAIGYHTNLVPNGRLRFSPRLSLGTYDGFEGPFTSHSLLAGLDLDLGRIQSFALFIGIGSGFNLSSSYADEHLHKLSYIFNFHWGFRFYKPEWKTGFELSPFDLSLGTDGVFGEFRFLKVRIIINNVKF